MHARMVLVGLVMLAAACQQRAAPAGGSAAAPSTTGATAPGTVSATVPAPSGASPGTSAGASPSSSAGGASPSSSAGSASPSVAVDGAARHALSASETARLDALMRLEHVFASPAARAAYRARPPETTADERRYTFELAPQPGMVEGQHHHVLTFAFAPAGTLLQQASSEPEIMSGGGPQSSFVRATARSADGAYDVRVTERLLLPSSLPRPELSAETALLATLKRLERASAP